MEENKKDKVKSLTTINFSITKCPYKVFEEFCSYAKEETNDNYSMALKLLLDGMKGNIKEVHIYEQYMILRKEFEDFKDEMYQKIQEKDEKLKTFGSKKE